MKSKIISVIIHLLITIFIYFTLFNYYETDNYNTLISLGQNTYQQPGISANTILIDVENTIENYDKIKKISDNYNANLCATKVKEENGLKYITKYIYGNNFSLYDDIKLESGTFFNKSNIESDSLISTEITNSESQLGRLSDFSGNNIVNIKTLKYGVSEGALGLSITVVAKDADYRKFEKEMKSEGIRCMNITQDLELPTSDKSLFYITVFFSVMIIILLNTYELFNSYKAIAVKKMVGYSYFSLCSEKILFLAISQTASSLLVFFIFNALMFKNKTYLFHRFSIDILTLYGVIVIFSILSVLIIYLISNKFSTASLIKNNNFNFKLIVFNIIFKTLSGIFAILFICKTIISAGAIQSGFSRQIEKWNEVRNYYCISGISNIDENHEYDPGITDDELLASYNAYCDLNKKGAILCYFQDYDDREIKDYENEHGKENAFIFLSDNVNPNYLKINKVFDTDGNPISISDDYENIVYLIPEKYRSQNEFAYNRIKYWNEEKSDKNIEIIWIKNGQEVFTYNWYFEYDKGCYRKDPVLCVNTLANSDPIDLWYFAGAANGPVKLECKTEQDIKDFYSTLYKYFDNNLYAFDIYNFYDSVSEQASRVTFTLKYLAIAAACTLIVLLLLILQNIKVYFREFEKENAVYYLNGYSFFRAHIVLWAGFAISFSVIVAVDMMILHSLQAFEIIIICGITELIVTAILAKIYSHRNLVNTLKKT